VVRKVYEYYTVAGLSIGAITRLLNEQGVPTRKRISRWERSGVWAMLRNPAYKGTACFNKTKTAKRQRITRPIRLRGGFASRDSANHERPREEWIEIPVPADCHRGDLCAGRGAASGEQSPCASSYDHTQRRAGLGVVPQMQLRSLSHFDADKCADDLLLSLPRLRRMAPPWRAGV